MQSGTIRFALPACALLSMLSGCVSMETKKEGDTGVSAATTETAPHRSGTELLNSLFNTVSGLLGGPSYELRRRLEAGDLDGAHAWYRENAAALDEDEGVQPQLAQLAGRLQERAEPELRTLAAELNAADAAVPANWPDLQQRIRRAQALLKTEETDPLLSHPAFRLPHLPALRTALNRASSALQANAAAAFRQYDPAAPAAFFDAYPLALGQTERDALMKARASDLSAAISRNTGPRALQILRNYYGQSGDPAVRRQLVQAWYRQQVGARADKPLTHAQRKEAQQALRAQAPELQIASSIAVLPLREQEDDKRRAAWETRNRKLAALLGAELLPPVEGTQASRKLGELQDRYDYVVLADSARSAATIGALSRRSQTGRYVVRKNTQPNPKKIELQQRLDQEMQRLAQAESARRRAEQEAKNATRQTQSSAVALMGVLNASTHIFETTELQSSVDSLRDELASTPAYVQVPVYAEYERQAVSYRAMALSPLVLHVVDMSGRRVQTRHLPSVVESSDLQGFEHVHPNDEEAAPVRDQAKQDLREKLRLRALEALPATTPGQDELLAGLDNGAEPLNRLPALMQSAQQRFRQEIERHQSQLLAARQ